MHYLPVGQERQQTRAVLHIEASFTIKYWQGCVVEEHPIGLQWF